MPFKDLREFISALEKAGELRRVEGANWDLEIGTLAELSYEREGPALLFDGITGYPKGYRILTNAADTLRRALLAVDLPIGLDSDAADQRYREKVASFKPVPPVKVKDGPIFENVFTGDQVNLWKFPTPRWHENDGGRYLGTGCAVIMRDPDTQRVHLGTYRVMVQDEKTAGLYISPPHTGSTIRRKYWQKGESCPVAVLAGQDPALFLGAAAYFSHDKTIPRYDLIGHMRGAPVEVVYEERTGLPIPASAEIVIAGEVPPPEVETRAEGPFGEWTGYYASGARPEPVIRVGALYHRNDPIILGVPPVKYRRSTAHFGIPTIKVKPLRDKLEKMGVEDVLDVWPLAVPGVTVVKIRQRYPGHAMKAGLAVSGEYIGRFVVVVDEDIDARDPEQVLWAIGTRCDPQESITVLKGCQSSPLDPRIPPEQKTRRDFTNSQAVIDACKPYHWYRDFPPTNVASPELRRKILEKWAILFAPGKSGNREKGE